MWCSFKFKLEIARTLGAAFGTARTKNLSPLITIDYLGGIGSLILIMGHKSVYFFISSKNVYCAGGLVNFNRFKPFIAN